jgi:hypothetical protein
METLFLLTDCEWRQFPINASANLLVHVKSCRFNKDKPLTTENTAQTSLEKIALVVLRNYYGAEAINDVDFNCANLQEPSQALIQTSKLLGSMKSSSTLLSTARSLVEELKERPQWPPHAVASLIVYLFTLVQHTMLYVYSVPPYPSVLSSRI